MQPDFSLYLVTDRVVCRSNDLVTSVIQAVQGGVTAVQLRDKHMRPRELIQLASALLQILGPLGIPLLINDDPHIAKLVGAQGVHVGKNDMSPSEARKILGDDALVGYSVESLADTDSIPFHIVNYIAVSPVFPTSTKTNAAKPLLLSGLRELKKISPVPVVAIGGIQLENLDDVLDHGADGVAVISAILGSENPQKAAEEFSRRLLKHRSRR